ncbi:MAG: type I-A CRISPR-associated protein Csa5 [Candidatus Jordarchaeales archaeon]
MQSLELSKYRGIATALATVCVASGSYSVIDRVANALSLDSVSRAIYENARMLETLLRRYRETGGRQGVCEEKFESGGKELTRVRIVSDEGEYFVEGYLADSEQVKAFLEDVSRDIRLARSVASYAMSMVASCMSAASKKST